MSVPVVSIAQMREWEAASWAAGASETAVIERVGQLVAEAALRRTVESDLVLILAGKGHNGDDARCAAPHLAGRRVELLTVTEPGAAQAALVAALGRTPALVIDGLFGIGLNRGLAADWVAFIEAVNASRRPVLAVDVPSGLNADSGQPFGAAIRAETTLTLAAPKAGLLAAAASAFTGRLEVAPEIGLVHCPHSGDREWLLPQDFREYPPRRAALSHKGSYGHLTIVAGSVGYHGAAVLAARAAQRAQPGLISLFTPTAAYVPAASQLQSVMVHPWSGSARWPNTTSAVLFGPGLAAPDVPDTLKQELTKAWKSSLHPVVVDASGLAWLPQGATASASLRVITPHPGEAAHLLRTSASVVQNDRVGAVRELSRQYGDCWVVLKGYQTLVGRSRGAIGVNGSGNPSLAQGGSGDALAGFLGGLLAQPELSAAPATALRYGVWEHGAAADRLSARRRGWTIEELVQALGEG